LNAGKICDFQEAKSVFDHGLETSLHRFNISSDGARMVVIFLKTDRDSEAIVRYVVTAIASEYPKYSSYRRGWVETKY